MKFASKLFAVALVVSLTSMSSYAFYQAKPRFAVSRKPLVCKGKLIKGFSVANKKVVSRVTSRVSSEVVSSPSSKGASRVSSEVSSKVTSYVALPKMMQYKFRRFCNL